MVKCIGSALLQELLLYYPEVVQARYRKTGLGTLMAPSRGAHTPSMYHMCCFVRLLYLVSQ